LKHFLYLKKLLAFAFEKNPLLYVALLVSAFSVLLEIAAMTSLIPLAAVASGQPLQSQALLNRALGFMGLIPDARGLILLFIFLFMLRLLTQFASQALVVFLSKRLFAQMSTRAFHNLLGVIPIREVEQSSIGSYIALAGDEAFRASSLIGQMSQLVGNVLLAGLYFIAIWTFSGVVAFAVSIFLSVTFMLMLRAFRVIHQLGHIQVEQSREASSLFLDALNGLRTVRAYGAESFVDKKYSNQLGDYVRTLVRIDIVGLLTRIAPALLLFAGAAVYTYQAPVAMGSASDFAFGVTVVLLLMRFFPVVGQTVGIAQRVIADARAGRDVTELVSKQCSYSASITTMKTLRVDEVYMRDVCFSYRQDNPVLRDVNIRLQRGKSYAFIGRSGSGKSTVMDLLLRFYEPESGEILLDGDSVSDVSEWEVRQRILLVAQETTIFNDTVANNIRFGIEASDAEVMRACQIACIDDLVADLPHGLDARLDYRGTNLSGGQRQRIGLARALLRHAPVLLLDESTSALDSDTRSRVVANLKDAYQDRTLVFVTHDANIINLVDEVLDISKINQLKSRDRDKSDAVI